MLSAIVLAAGEAKRFGRCKQLIPLGGKTLLEHVLGNLRRSKIDDVVVVLGAYADEIREQVRFENERLVSNPDYAGGMSTSIQAGLRALPATADAAMIVLADQPFVTAATLDALAAEYERTRASVVLPTYNGFRGNPVIVDRALFAEMMNLRGDIGCRSVFGDHADSIVKVAVEDQGVVTDIDTQQDLDRGVPAAASSRSGDGQQERELVTMPKSDMPKSDMPKSDHFETIVDLRRRRHPFAVATIVRAERPTSSKPGDKAIITPDGLLTGWIGGSCAHDIVVHNALESLGDGVPRFLTLSATTPSGAQRQGVLDVQMQCYSGGVLDVFIEPNLPRARMVIVGHETVAHALVRISSTMQFHVTVVDPLATRASLPEADDVINDLKLADLQLGSDSCIVIATHGRYDEEALEQATRTEASYIALVSSPKRARVIIDQLRERGMPEDALARIKSPAGLDIGAQGAEEIALSIVAEIIRDFRAGKVKKPDTAPAPAPETATDPVCQMTVVIADARYTAEHEGRRYYFCCQHCQHVFEKEPRRYAHVA
jgi:xanthine dehydrogenase accessory factor